MRGIDGDANFGLSGFQIFSRGFEIHLHRHVIKPSGRRAGPTPSPRRSADEANYNVIKHEQRPEGGARRFAASWTRPPRLVIVRVAMRPPVAPEGRRLACNAAL